MTATDSTIADVTQADLDASPCRIGSDVTPFAPGSLASIRQAVASAGRDLDQCDPRHYAENHAVYVRLLQKLQAAERSGVHE